MGSEVCCIAQVRHRLLAAHGKDHDTAGPQRVRMEGGGVSTRHWTVLHGSDTGNTAQFTRK